MFFIIGFDLGAKIVNKININKFKANAVVGFGNYISFPLCLAAKIKKIPIILHEQNSIMGKANKILGYIAEKDIAHDSARMLSEYDVFDNDFRKAEQQGPQFIHKKTN